MDKPSTVDCSLSCSSWPRVSFSSKTWFWVSVAMSTRVRNKALVRDTLSDKDVRRCEVASTVAMAGDKRRCINSPTVWVPAMGRSRNSAMRCLTSVS